MSLYEASMSEYDQVDQFGAGDYDWSTTTVYRRKADGKLFYVNESGCSCVGPGEYLSPGDLTPLNNITDFREAVAETSDSWSERSEVEAFVDKFFTKKNIVRVKPLV